MRTCDVITSYSSRPGIATYCFQCFVAGRLSSFVMSKEMRGDPDLRSKVLSFLFNTQFLAAITSLSILRILDLWLISEFRQTPDKIGMAHNPYFGDFVYSLKTEMIVFADLILFVILFPITNALFGRFKRRYCK